MEGLLTWTHGTMSGTGKMIANGGMVIGNELHAVFFEGFPPSTWSHLLCASSYANS